MRLRVCALLAILLVGCPAQWASAGSTRSKTVTFLLVRTTSGASNFTLSVSADVSADGAFVGEMDAHISPHRNIKAYPGFFTSAGSDVDDTAVVAGHRVSLCTAEMCGQSSQLEGLVFGGVSYSADNSRGDVNAIFIVARGDRVRYSFAAKGWRLQTAHFNYSTVHTAAVAPAYVSVAGRGAAALTGATATGGPLGSLAEAVPPCSTSDVGLVSRGVGRISLLGGRTQPSFVCPRDVVPIAAAAQHRTKWKVEGLAAGDSTLAGTALFVVDLPRRLPQPSP